MTRARAIALLDEVNLFLNICDVTPSMVYYLMQGLYVFLGMKGDYKIQRSNSNSRRRKMSLKIKRGKDYRDHRTIQPLFPGLSDTLRNHLNLIESNTIQLRLPVCPIGVIDWSSHTG
jgi:hypothetical protein